MKDLLTLFKKITFKQVLLMIGILILYFLPYLFFQVDLEFYNSLKKIDIPPIVFSIVWTFIYICMTIFIFWHLNLEDSSKHKSLWIYVVLNYLIESSYMAVFFEAHNLFLSYIVAILTFVTIVLVALEAFSIKKETTWLLLPYLLWSAFASVLAVLIYIWN